MPEKGASHELTIILEREVLWVHIAPLLDQLQEDPQLLTAEVRRETFRIAAGGPGFDIVPTLLLVAASALIIEAVRDLYPKIKETLYSVYSRLPGITSTGKVYPVAIRIVEPSLEALYRIPEGLSQSAFAQALNTIPTHFAGLKGRDDASLVFTYAVESGGWVENVEASEFETWIRRRQMKEADGPTLTDDVP